jgi:hypothetical protein
MKWCKSIVLEQPLGEARLVPAGPSQSPEAGPAPEAQLEQAAFERGG